VILFLMGDGMLYFSFGQLIDNSMIYKKKMLTYGINYIVGVEIINQRITTFSSKEQCQ